MCRLAAAVGIDNAAEIVREMLMAQQHGGQEGAGIASHHNGQLYVQKGFGLVDEVFGQLDMSQALPGRTAIGHVRYATTGESRRIDNVHPFVGRTKNGELAVVHNGNLTNYAALQAELFANGCVLRTDSDTELVLSLLGHVPGNTLAERLVQMHQRAEGAVTLLTLSEGSVYASRDPYGWRPLSIARYQGGYLVATETRAFRLFGITEWETFEGGGGQIRVLHPDAPREIINYTHQPMERRCVFEKVYFAMPDSEIFGNHVGQERRRMGAALAAKMPVAIDVIVAVPDSANVAAEAVAAASGKPLRHGIVRSKYGGRTFIMPQQAARKRGVRMKFGIDYSVIHGQHVGVVDDSIVRGTTTRQIVQLLREAGALSVHLLVSSPPVVHPCHWGIDTPHRQELIAARVPFEQLASELGVDSVTYLTESELLSAVADPQGKRHCTYCFTGRKPVEHHQLPDEQKKD